jgi:hypothetical protein
MLMRADQNRPSHLLGFDGRVLSSATIRAIRGKGVRFCNFGDLEMLAIPAIFTNSINVNRRRGEGPESLITAGDPAFPCVISFPVHFSIADGAP